ncbi:hypothetical protein F383_23581 [Gossypium arboreum]|uniref:Uncharacterized protein n=1 Tax=Gossypium arboreum TaxID=29729 RepID=A0A0B0NN12_GOSAR|nr:hypothetical protein F383_23581 [Gossypium arboreum]
MAVWLNGQAV